VRTWTVRLYRRDSSTPVDYDHVKHAWTEGQNFVVAQYDGPATTEHHYWIWPWELISHVRVKRNPPDTQTKGQ